MTNIIPSNSCPEDIVSYDNHLIVWRKYQPPPYVLWRQFPEMIFNGDPFDIAINIDWTSTVTDTSTASWLTTHQWLLPRVQSVLDTWASGVNSNIIQIWNHWYITIENDGTYPDQLEDIHIRVGQWVNDIIWSQPYTNYAIPSNFPAVANWDYFSECKLFPLPTSWSGGWWLPAPIIRLRPKNINSAIIRDYEDNEDIDVYSPPTIVTQDLTQEQLDMWVRVEFLYYRTWKRPTKKGANANANKAWFVHPTLTNLDGTAVFTHTDFRSWKHNWVGMYRPSEFEVLRNQQKIPLYEALNGRLRFGTIAYRNTDWNVIRDEVHVFAPIRRRSKYQDSVSDGVHYSPILAPLYFTARYAIRMSNNKWISWPIGNIISLAPKVHPFLYDPVSSATNSKQCAIINTRYNPRSYKCFMETSRLPT